ncbi:prolyl oligopeptidase family serine peptidase [bacterium]|nr:prolyl oligopeptidase family serine peptidase [bacterium]
MAWVALLTLTASTLLSGGAVADEKSYQVPSQELVDIVDAPRTPRVGVSPDREWLMLMQRPGYPSIEELSERELRLAGLRIKPSNDSRSRVWPYDTLTFLRRSDLEQRPVTGLPDNPRIGRISWAPGSERISFTNTTPEGVELWIADVADGRARRLTDSIISLTAGSSPTWLADGEALVACVVPDGRGAEPQASRVPTGPIIQENLGQRAPARTYQDLLSSPDDEALFDHYLTTQLALVGLDGEVKPLGDPAIIWGYDPSPDGTALLVWALHRPYSYVVPAYRFPERIEVWDLDGNVLHTVADHPLRDAIPIARGSTHEGPRSVQWRADAPATLAWVEALDGGDAGREAEVRDRVFMLAAPFDRDPEVLMTLEFRSDDIYWGHNELALVTEWWWDTRLVQAWKVAPDASREPALLLSYSWEDRYNDPGVPVMTRNWYGRSVLLTADDAHTIYLTGEGASPEGDRPFLDAFDTYHKETRRLFRSEAPHYERPILVFDKTGRHVLTTREAEEEVPNYFVRDLADGTLRQITFFEHPTPGLLGVSKELIRYQRADGVDLTATLYLPSGYEQGKDGPLPMVMSAYPREFKSAAAAGQVDDSPFRFNWVGWWSPLLWLTQGYSVLEGPTMPIVGEGDEEPNDTYIKQLVASAQAAVDEVVRRGVADRERIAIGGHSYGAFMTANLLAHSDIFAAGLARTGAYNRTLTPFGFQSEDRTLWEAPDVYFEMSPFMHADKINEPLLLVHGEADNNPGTFPMQSERFFAALKGHGATVRLVMLPHESHSYRARESLLHLLWETEHWLDMYVKDRVVE